MEKRLNLPKRFLVTGGLGFIGSHFIEKCLVLGHSVVNYDKVTYASNTNLKFVGDYTFIQKDICDIKQIPRCDFIVNFAAESHVDNSIAQSLNFFNSNIAGVYNLLEVIKNNKINSVLKAQQYICPIFVQISTDEVFGDIDVGSFSENDGQKSSNPYSATKAAAEQLVFAWSRTYDIPYIMTRTTNNYGKRQHIEKLIPCAISKLLLNKLVPIHGNGTYIRNWIHVEDNVDAILTILDSGNTNEVYHIATNEEYSINQIVSKICDKLQRNYLDSVDYNSDRVGADFRYALNFEKLTKLGWKPTRNLSASLDDIIDYYKQGTI